ncbi:MAG: condensation domain-containing protein, partial [Flammeovirgaceae bacterium]
MHVAGSGVGLGYLNDPEKTHASFIADPLHTSTTRLYKTGDLGRYKPGGEIEFIGRTDDQIKLFGHRIELGEIEDKLSMLTGASQLAVLLLDGPDQNRYLVAYFQAHEKFSVESLKEDLRKFLPEYMVPALIVQLEKMPLTSNGKIDKKQLQRMEVDAADEFKTELLDSTESIILSIWKDVLKRSDLTSKQNFFLVGGNSLLANLVAIRLNKELHTNVQLYDLFTHTNVRDLATLVGKLGNTEACKIKPIEDQDYYAPSHSQRRMWILQHLKNDQTAFNVNGAYRLSGHVDVELFQKAVGSVIAQHQAIRTVFPVVLGEPVQMVKEIWDLTSLIDVVNCVHVRDTDRDDYIRREIISFSSIPFDLSRDLPIRIRILTFSNDDVAIVFVLHHIASDGWSKQLIEQQIFSAYSKMLKGNWNNSSSKELQFRDYSSWQNNLLGEDKLYEDRLYWKNKLSSHTPEPFDFPFQYERPATRNYAGASIDVDLPAEVSRKLREYCEKKGVTLFVVFVSIVQLVFHKLSGKDKLTVGVALAGRNHDDLLKLAGFFVNALPLTTTIGQGTTFNNMVGQVNKLVVEMLSHESYPFDVLVDELDIRREQGRNAMFDILLEVHQFETIRTSVDADLSRDSAFDVKEIKIPETSSINDMNLVLNERDGHLTLHVRFDTQLFTNEAVMRLAGYMLSVTNELVSDESLHIDQLE